ncbi:hypothetical protein MYXA107069_13655 [Myxococcus xanthus]|nr:hypothetical protein MyxoNM_34025 [Myxococcus xanthus]SDW22067.1 hypothetical protein SAMN05444383_101691 [Myxococcus xanthus]
MSCATEPPRWANPPRRVVHGPRERQAEQDERQQDGAVRARSGACAGTPRERTARADAITSVVDFMLNGPRAPPEAPRAGGSRSHSRSSLFGNVGGFAPRNLPTFPNSELPRCAPALGAARLMARFKRAGRLRRRSGPTHRLHRAEKWPPGGVGYSLARLRWTARAGRANAYRTWQAVPPRTQQSPPACFIRTPRSEAPLAVRPVGLAAHVALREAAPVEQLLAQHDDRCCRGRGHGGRRRPQAPHALGPPVTACRAGMPSGQHGTPLRGRARRGHP